MLITSLKQKAYKWMSYWKIKYPWMQKLMKRSVSLMKCSNREVIPILISLVTWLALININMDIWRTSKPVVNMKRELSVTDEKVIGCDWFCVAMTWVVIIDNWAGLSITKLQRHSHKSAEWKPSPLGWWQYGSPVTTWWSNRPCRVAGR